jgi:predicted metal-binding protein
MPGKIKMIVIVQCDIVLQRCPGYFCDKVFTNRSDAFKGLPLDENTRKISLSCGGCCGRAIHRKLTLLAQKAGKDGIRKEDILVKISSCISKDNYHGPQCPHLDYIKKIIDKTGIPYSLDTTLSAKAEAKREAGIYSR